MRMIWKILISFILLPVIMLVLGVILYGIGMICASFDNEGQAMLFLIILAYVIQGAIFGAITKHVARTKGYDDGFAWGFLLGILGLLIVGFRANLNETNRHPQKVIVKIDEAEKIEKLAKLHQQGILTDEEFSQKKADILSKM